MIPIIILGCEILKINDNFVPSDILKSRLDKGIELFHQINSLEKFIIVTGGSRSYKISEAIVMQQYLISQGISSNLIFTETHAINTMENLLKSYALIKTLERSRLTVKDFSPWIFENRELMPCFELYIVTSDFHIPRTEKLSNMVFPKHIHVSFISASSSPIDYLKRSQNEKQIDPMAMVMKYINNIEYVNKL